MLGLPSLGKATPLFRVASGRGSRLAQLSTCELSGRHRVYLNWAHALLGMGRREIASNFEEITDSSGIERFVDVPVKCYSSSTYARPALALAAHLEPEIAVWRTTRVRRRGREAGR
jgi:ABC-type polysaccharide/polyol phosphate transport system ATPase subunit